MGELEKTENENNQRSLNGQMNFRGNQKIQPVAEIGFQPPADASRYVEKYTVISSS
jgi:hypothetical protein